MRIVMIGSGNVATILGRKCLVAGHTVLHVYGRHADTVEEVATQLKATAVTDVQQLDTTADIYIIAVADTAVATVAGSLQLGNKLLVHTAGSVSKEVLQAGSSQYGVLYPLQSLRKGTNRLPDIPFVVDGNTAQSLGTVHDLAASLSTHVQQAGDEQRLRLHVAAVIVSNFTNHLYTLADDYCRAEGVDFSLLHPLINEVAQRLYQSAPRHVQTGPAVRHDTETIQKHLALLEQHRDLQELYGWFSEKIQAASH